MTTEIQGVKLRFALDTGANFSVIMRSEAERLKLAILPVGLQVNHRFIDGGAVGELVERAGAELDELS